MICGGMERVRYWSEVWPRLSLWFHGVCPSCSLTRTGWALASWWDAVFVKLGTVEYCETVARHCRSFGTVGLVNCYKSSLKWGSHHPVLGNLELDFTDSSNKAVDTVIIAGNNGIGKSSLVELLYQIMAHKYHDMPCYVDSIEVDFDSKILTYEFYAKDIKGHDYLYVKDGLGLDNWVGSDEFAEIFPTSAIFSDVDINFKSDQITSVTSRNIDESVESIRSSSDLPTEINQLIIDIQALDDADVARVARNNMETGLSRLQVPQRMPRFTKSFDLMFDDLNYDRVDNRNGHKACAQRFVCIY